MFSGNWPGLNSMSFSIDYEVHSMILQQLRYVRVQFRIVIFSHFEKVLLLAHVKAETERFPRVCCLQFYHT